MNLHYKNRYYKFINVIKSLGDRNLIGYTEIHHIVPRCLKGSDDKENLVELTLREHFLAHWLLWKAYPDYLPLASAFLQMNNKNPKLKDEFQGRTTSKTYQILKTKVYEKLSELTKDKVRVRDDQGQILTLTREQYANQNTHQFHTTGKLYAFDKTTNTWVYITSREYQENKDRYKSRMSFEGFPYGTSTGNPNASINVESVRYQFIDTKTNVVVKISKSEAKTKNQEYGYKRLKHIQKKQVRCIDDQGQIYLIALDDYNPTKHKFYSKNKIVVYDTQDNQNKKIDLDEYNLNKSRYLTSTRGKVLAKDQSGNTILITREEFNKGNYVGQTKGLRTVRDSVTGLYVQISEQEYLKNKKQYTGPNKGKVNVIDKQTGERKQILKENFDSARYSGLGNKKLLFLCRNKLTNQEKLVNIYEWHLLQDHYQIIDYEKYQIALSSK